jgi:geranylgeranyl pyrophosphate synthase
MEAQSTRQQDACLAGTLKPEQWLDNHLCDHILRIYGDATFFAAAAMECAAVIGKADDPARAACIQLGRVFGISLQIVKDIEKFDPEHTCHGDGSDGITLGNPTYVIARALLSLRKSKRLRLAEILHSTALRHDPATRNEAIELVRKSGALESARKTAREMIEKEWIRFSMVLPASEPKTMLRVFSTFILDNGKKLWRP